MSQTTTQEYCKVVFTRDQRAELALELARANQSMSELEAQRKQVAAAIKAQIEEQSATVQRLARFVNDGYEFKNVNCTVLLDYPQKGQKTIQRDDTFEVVRVIAMTDADRQQALKFEEEREAAKA